MDELKTFCTLFQGGKLAIAPLDGVFRPHKNDDGSPISAEGESWRSHCQNHLYNDFPIGVYPLMEIDDECFVNFGVIDWDVGDSESLVHATNTRNLLRQVGITSWIEPSRSKGMHLWIFPQEVMAASTMRDALMAACQIVKAPTDEVNPKQTSLVGKGWGNGIRLPYPKGHREGRQVILSPSGGVLSLSDAMRDITAKQPSKEEIEALAGLYKPPPPEPLPVLYSRPSHYSEKDFIGVAKEIWDYGPRRQGQHRDRSKMLFAFAGSLAWQGFTEDSIMRLTTQVDERWGRKYVDRPDGMVRLNSLVKDATRAAGKPQQQSFGQKEKDPF